MIGDGFERRRNQDEKDYNFPITNDEVLKICKTKNVISHVVITPTLQKDYRSTTTKIVNAEDQTRLLNSMSLNTTTHDRSLLPRIVEKIHRYGWQSP